MDEAELSLADFQFADNAGPLAPNPEYLSWRDASAWATSLYEPHLLGAPAPRVELVRAGERRAVINMSSYNYLGFATHPQVIAAAREALERYGTGACGSPILSGMTDLHRQLEARLSAFMGREDTLLFNSGFGGATGVMAGLLRRGDAAILDARCHMSLFGGVNLARARTEVFDHNDPASLDAALTKTAGRRRLVAVEGVYSMDGDEADLPALLEVCEAHGCGLFIDEAHSILTHGATGRGVHQAHQGRVGLVFATFSKAFAGLGGFVSGSRDVIDYLRYYAAPYGFSCALPPSVVAGLLAVLDLVEQDDGARRRMWDNASYFRESLQALGVDTGESTSQVVPIVVGSDRRRLYELCHQMSQRGLFLPPVDFPSVPEDGLRFRAAVTAAHTREDLDEALQIIEDTVGRTP